MKRILYILTVYKSTLMFCNCSNSKVSESNEKGNDTVTCKFKVNENITYNDYSPLTLELDNCITVSTPKAYNTEPLISVYKENELIDTFRIESNGYVHSLYKSKYKNTFYLLSVGGSASVGMIAKVNVKKRTYTYKDYDAWGFTSCKRQGHLYIIQCKTNPLHSNSLISYQWVDTLDIDFNVVGTSDTIEVHCE